MSGETAAEKEPEETTTVANENTNENLKKFCVQSWPALHNTIPDLGPYSYEQSASDQQLYYADNSSFYYDTTTGEITNGVTPFEAMAPPADAPSSRVSPMPPDTSAPESPAKKKRKKSTAYSEEEVESLLEAVGCIQPKNDEDWETVKSILCTEQDAVERTSQGIKQKFRNTASKLVMKALAEKHPLERALDMNPLAPPPPSSIVEKKNKQSETATTSSNQELSGFHSRMDALETSVSEVKGTLEEINANVKAILSAFQQSEY